MKTVIEVHLQIKIAEKNGKFWFRIIEPTRDYIPPYQEGPFPTRQAALDKANRCLEVAKEVMLEINGGNDLAMDVPPGTIMTDLKTVN